MSTKIGVAIRVRPFLENEKKLAMQSTKLQILPAEKEIRIQNEDMRGYKSFKFDKVLDQDTTQSHLFHQTQIQDLINKVIEGYHSTIFAYGQTGSGKTYTMEGYKYELDSVQNDLSALANPFSKDAGIIPRSINTLFESIKQYSKLYKRNYTVYCSYLQIYNEKIYDLLNPAQMTSTNPNKPGGGLRLRWTQKDQFAVENLFVFECRTAEEVLSLFHQGIKNKIMASHKLNLASSRSHCILSLRVDSCAAKSDNIVTSKLDLVDLAGSERTSMTGNDTQIAQKESIEINKSLFTLRQVIATLADMQKSPGEKNKDKLHIPYRDSKLTCLLKQSIGGNCYCLMIACLAPADRYFEENLSTLTYATKAAYISNDPMRNDDSKTKMISDLKVQVSNLSKELEKANTHINFLSQFTNEKVRTFTADFGSDKRASSGFRDTSFRAGRNEAHGRTSYSRTSEKRGGKTPESLAKRKTMNFGEETSLKFNRQESIGLSEKGNGLEDIRTPEVMSGKLIESITTVKDLLKSNKEVRERMDKLVGFSDNLHGELHQLHQENQDLREKLTVYESLFSGGLPTQGHGAQDEGVPLAEGKIDYNKLNGSPNEKKFYPTSNLRGGKKKESDSFQAHQYYQTLISKPKQKYLPDLHRDGSPKGHSHPRTVSTPSKDNVSMETESSTKINFGRYTESKRMSSPEISNKLKQKEMRLTGNYLPQIRDNSLEMHNEGNNTIADISIESMKKTNNVWLSGFIKRRANSTLKKIRNDDKSINKTISEMNRVQMFSAKAEET